MQISPSDADFTCSEYRAPSTGTPDQPERTFRLLFAFSYQEAESTPQGILKGNDSSKIDPVYPPIENICWRRGGFRLSLLTEKQNEY